MSNPRHDKIYLRKDHNSVELRAKLWYEFAKYFNSHARDASVIIVSYNLAVVDSAQLIQFVYKNHLTLRIETQPNFSDPYFYFTEV